MQFLVHPGDGTRSRYTDKLRFVDSQVVTYTLTVTSTGLYLEGADGEAVFAVTDLNEAAQHLARLLAACYDQSLIAAAADCVRTGRGNEGTSTDIYPPGRHPRIVIER